MKRIAIAILLLLASGLVTTLILRVAIAIVRRIAAGSSEYETGFIIATMIVALLLSSACIFLLIRKAYRTVYSPTATGTQ